MPVYTIFLTPPNFQFYTCATYANTLHQAGYQNEAYIYFHEAEQIQARCDPSHPLLYAQPSFEYCDLLLTEAECVTWQLTLNPHFYSARRSSLCDSCYAVLDRVTQTIKWFETHPYVPVLVFALDHLTLGRTKFYTAKLESSHSNFATPSSELDIAVSGLRRAGQQHHLPLGLLNRSWLRFLTGAYTGPDSAQEDLDEAWEIAERGPMRLYMADIHLYRARLFGGTKEGKAMEYPWESPQADLAAARRLIEQCGYGRRKEELEDAEKAILGAVQGSASP